MAVGSAKQSEDRQIKDSESGLHVRCGAECGVIRRNNLSG